MKKYYIDIHIKNNGYVLQSKLFSTEKQAMKWFVKSFDYVDFASMTFYLVVADYKKDDFEDYVDIESYNEITKTEFIKELQG